MAPVDVFRRIVVSNPSQHAPTTLEQQDKIGICVTVGFFVICMLYAAYKVLREHYTKKKLKRDEATRRHKHHHHHHRQHSRSHSKSGKQIAADASTDNVELQRLQPIIPAGKDQVVRAAPQGSSRRYSPSSLSKSTLRRGADKASASSSRAHNHHSYRSRTANYPAVVPRTSSLADRARARHDHHSQRHRTSALRRSGPLGWPLPRVVVTDSPSSSQRKPRAVVRAEIRPAAPSSSSHLRPPPAHHYGRELRRTEKFSMTQSERGDRVRDSDESGSDSGGDDAGDRTSRASGASSGICDYLKLLNSSSPAPGEQPKENSKPQLPALGFSHRLSFEAGDDKYGI